jgi:ParB family transcriptional regulator, chromosome partitioning protein
MTTGIQKIATAISYKTGLIYDIGIEQLLIDSTSQPRKFFDPSELEDLKQSIKDKGLIYPIIFRQDDLGKLILVSGERRLKACKALGNTSILGIFLDTQKYDEIALIDNIQRVDLHPVDEAESVKYLKGKYKYTDVQIGNLIGKARNTVTDIIALTTLTAEILTDARQRSDLSRSALLKVARIKKAAAQSKTYEALKASLEKKKMGKVKRPRISLYKKTIATTEQNIKFIKNIDLNRLGEDRVPVVEKLQELFDELKNILATTES